MKRPLRILSIAAGAILGLTGLVFAFGLMLLPRDFIDRQAVRLASQVRGATVHWDHLTPTVKGLAIGVKLEGLTVRVPSEGEPRTDARTREVFVRFRLLPLLARQVEVSSAQVTGAWVSLYERGPQPEAAAESLPSPKFKIHVPRLDFDDLNILTRDPYGSGQEIRHLSGHVDLKGLVDAPTAIGLSATAESLFWKPSAGAALVLLPSPVKIDVSMDSRRGAEALIVKKGSVSVGSLESAVRGSMRFPKNDPKPGPIVNLTLSGGPQKVGSDDRAWKGITAKIPAKWHGTASWNVRASGRAPDIVTDGVLTLRPLSVSAQNNSFSFGDLRAVWNTRADRTFTASARGSGSGVAVSMEARGTAAPGGSTRGVVAVRAPAARLNGLMPNAPKLDSGEIECRAVFTLAPPAPPEIRWGARGSGINAVVQGLARPVRGLQFDAEGAGNVANIRSMRTNIGSSNVSLTGTVIRGRPLSTGSFHIALDRFLSEEWAPPAGGKAPQKVEAPHPARLPIPIGAFTGSVAIGEAHSGGMVLKNVSVPLRFDGSTLTAAPISASLGSGSVGGSLVVRSLFGSPSYSLHLDVKRAPIQQVAAGTIPFSSAVTGFLTGIVDLSGAGLPSPHANDTMKGLLKGSVEDGKVLLTPTVVAVARALGIVLKSEVTLRDETHSIRVAGRRMLLDMIRGDLEEDKAEMTGSVGLDHTLDLNLLLRLAPSRVAGGGTLAQIARYAKDAEGRVPVDIKITGTDRAPKISLSPSRTLAAAGQTMGHQIVSQLVKGLARRPDSLRKADSTLKADSAKNVAGTTKPAPARADSVLVDPLKKARDALKSILGK